VLVREMVLPRVGPADVLRERWRELPSPAPDEALVRVEATGVSFAEQQMRRGRYFDQPPFPLVPGYDLVGMVADVGREVREVSVGQRVAALTRIGAWTNYVLLPAADLIPVPEGVDPAEAEAVVVNGLTAWRMLHHLAEVERGQTIVVLGSNGGVGSTLVQLARLAGIHVIGTTSGRNRAAVRDLGAIPIDYRTDDVLARVLDISPGGVAAVFDHVGGEGLRTSWDMLANGGVLVAYGVAAFRDAEGDPKAPVWSAIALLTELQIGDDRGRRAKFFNVWDGMDTDIGAFRACLRADLTAVLSLLAAREIKALVARRFPLEQAAAALRLAESGTITGKIVLMPGLDSETPEA